MPPNNFKSDESFLQKLAVGAIGTQATIERLRALGFSPIELERGSSGFKIWKHIKIKRVRVPDILCLRTGVRFESRGKTKLEISMSHSLSDPNRAWDTGLHDDDYAVVVLCEAASDSVVDWRPASPVHFIRVAELRSAFKRKAVSITKPKGVEEGSEIRVIWPCKGANQDSHVAEVTDRGVRLVADADGQSQRIMLGRATYSLKPQCKAGDAVKRHQIVASVVPVALALEPKGDVGEKYFREKLSSRVLSERYAAAKALRFRGYKESADELRECLKEDKEDIYVRLEAAAALAAHGHEDGWAFLADALASEFNQVQLETVIVLSEIRDDRSQRMLIQVLMDAQRHEEIRAGAAWALGEFRNEDSTNALASVFSEASMEIKTEAARAMLRVSPGQESLLMELLKRSEQAKRDGLAWVMARRGNFSPADLLEGADDNLRRWVGYIVGIGKDKFVADAVQAVCERDPEVYFSATVLWQLLASWIDDIKEY